MTLAFNTNTGDYVLTTDDVERPRRAGLTLARRVRGPQGEKVWFTSCEYAALNFYRDADPQAKAKLDPLWRDYQKSKAITGDKDYPVPRGMELMPFQRAGVEYALERQHTLIGDQPGLGKSAQSLVIANACGYRRVLIICPGSIRLNWRKEVLKWSTLRNPSTYPILSSKDGVHPDANFTIVSYDLCRNLGLHEALCATRWDMIVMDEMHAVKSTAAKRTQALLGGGRGPFKKQFIAQNADRIIGLTGTPLPNRPREAYTIARALNWEAIDWMSYDAFCHRFNPSAAVQVRKRDGSEVTINREERGRLPELRARLRCNFMVRRLKRDVLTELPDTRYELTYVETSGPIRDVLAKERMIDFNTEDLKNPMAEFWGQVSTVRREMGEALAPRVVEHIRYLLDIVEMPKVVVFAHHRSVMDRLANDLHRYGVVQVRGGVSTDRKQAAVDDFMVEPNLRIFLGQIDAAGTGIDGLQNVAEHAVFAEAAWTPGVNEQAVDRLHRIGQHANVVAQFMVVEGSLTERILAAVFDKTKTIHESLDAV